MSFKTWLHAGAAAVLSLALSTTIAVATGAVNLSLSDPPTCSAPSGPYSHIFVTVTDVKIHTSGCAGPI